VIEPIDLARKRIQLIEQQIEKLEKEKKKLAIRVGLCGWCLAAPMTYEGLCESCADKRAEGYEGSGGW